VTRRYTLIKKKKTRANSKVGKGDIFIDVELFALDTSIRYFSPEKDKIMDVTLGGLLDIPFMRPREFGYDVIRTLKKGITYRNVNSNKMIINKKIFIASKEFLIDDIYLMHSLKLRPEKKEKDRQRLLRLAQTFVKTVKSTDSIDTIFKIVKPKLKTSVYSKGHNGSKRFYNKGTSCKSPKIQTIHDRTVERTIIKADRTRCKPRGT